MKITKVSIDKFSGPVEEPFVVACGVMESNDAWVVTIETDAGIKGIGSAAPWAPVTGETLESCYEVLKLLVSQLPGMDPLDIAGIHRYMDSTIYMNGSAKCAIDTALYDIAARNAGLPLYKFLGATQSRIMNDITISIKEPERMAAEAEDFVKNFGFSILKVKIGLDPDHDIRALNLIREKVGPDVRIRVDANQGFDVEGALKILPVFEKMGIDAVEQFLPYYDVEGAAKIMAANPTKVDLMLDESIFSVHDAERAARLKAAQFFNIKLMKCGGLYYGLKIADIAAAAGIRGMVGCMGENKISLTAGLSLVAAKDNIVEADCDSYMMFKGHDDGIVGGFRPEGGEIVLLDEPGLGIEL